MEIAMDRELRAAERIQRFWRRCCKNTLNALVRRMIDANATTTYLKSIRYDHSNIEK
jgi:hypothetical protein